MDAFLLAYITQRMCEMGFTKFHFEPVRIFVNALTTQIQAYNEFYYLSGKGVPASLIIISDTNIFNESPDYPDFNYYGIQEFTGLIEISQELSPISLEFVKVVPQATKKN